MATSSEKSEVKNKIEIRAMERRAMFAAISDYISFVSGKLLGVGFSVIGVHDLLWHDAFIPALTNPSLMSGAGIAILGGPKIAKMVNDLLIGLGS